MKNLSNENVIHVKKGDIEFLQFRKLLEFSDEISHAYSIGTNMNFKIRDNSEEDMNGTLENYKKICDCVQSDYTHVIRPHQKHTDVVKCVKENKHIYPEEYIDTDGLVTNKKGIALATINADCILLLFYDPIKKVIANTHSGWRGTLQRISIKTVEKMKQEYGSNEEDIICCICPSIRKCHFEVDKDVKDLFQEEFTDVENFIEEKVSYKKWHIDTVKVNIEILKKAGLKEENIIDCGICSVCNSDQIHSFRVEGKDYGASTALIEIKE